MKLLIYIFIISISYCLSDYVDQNEKRLFIKSYPKKVKPGLFIINNSGKYFKNKHMATKKHLENDYTVFPQTHIEQFHVPEDQPSVKKVLPDYWQSVRHKRSVDINKDVGNVKKKVQRIGEKAHVKPSTSEVGTKVIVKPPTSKGGTKVIVKPPTSKVGTKVIVKPPTSKVGTKFVVKPPTLTGGTKANVTHKGKSRKNNKSNINKTNKNRNPKHTGKRLRKRSKSLRSRNVKNQDIKNRNLKYTRKPLRSQNRAKLRSGNKKRMRILKGRKSMNASKKPIKVEIDTPNITDIDARRLIAARDAMIEEYPYVVSIQKEKQHWCAGALLNQRLVITTANCLWKARSISRMHVRAGTRYTDRGGQVAYIQEVMKHPGWKIRTDPDMDIALVLLDRRIKFSNAVHGVDLPNRVMLPAFEDAWVTSWGAERRDGVYETKGNTLQVYHARLMDRKKCNNVTHRFGVHVTDNFICMAQTGKRAPCTRDTGAPAVSDGVLWGLASWGIRKLCGSERFPAMFSYLGAQANLDFIINATHYLMADERFYPYQDRAPMLRNKITTPTVQTMPG